LALPHNIIDCYTAIIQLWQPGAHILIWVQPRRIHCSLPCHGAMPFRYTDTAGQGQTAEARRCFCAQARHARGQKRVPTHVSSPRDAQFLDQRKALAQQFRSEHASAEDQNAYPFFIGVFDTEQLSGDCRPKYSSHRQVASQSEVH
jgi:hypothetical protein